MKTTVGPYDSGARLFLISNTLLEKRWMKAYGCWCGQMIIICDAEEAGQECDGGIHRTPASNRSSQQGSIAGSRIQGGRREDGE